MPQDIVLAVTVDPSRHEAMYAAFQKMCETLSDEEIIRGAGVLAGPEAVRKIVREEMGRTAPASPEADRVTRIVDNRIDQFLSRHLKSKELAERIMTLARSESRLMYATSVEKAKQEIESRIAQEIEKAVDDLLRSDALTDRIRRVAESAVAAASSSKAANASA